MAKKWTLALKYSNLLYMNIKLAPIFKLLFIAWPLIEIAVFVWVGSMIGVLLTIALIIATTILGMSIMRTQGWVHLHGLQQRVQQGERPEHAMMSISLRMFGGFLLFLPGFVSDAIGLLLQAKLLRDVIINWMLGKGYLQPVDPAQKAKQDPGVIEGEFWRDDEK